MAKTVHEAMTVCDKNHDASTSNLLQDVIDKTERRKWFLFEILQPASHT